MPIYVAFEGQDNLIEAAQKKLSSELLEVSVGLFQEENMGDPGVHVGCFSEMMEIIQDKGSPMVFNVFGKLSETAEEQMYSLDQSLWISEDIDDESLDSRATYCVPATSFSYHTLELLNKLDEQ